MKLSNFKKNKKAKVIMGLSFVAIAGVTALGLYRSYALYESKKEYNVIKGTVPEFKASDLILSMTVDGKQSQNAPAKGNYGVVVSCDNASGEWDYDKWKALIWDFKASRAKCTIDFESKMSDYLVSLSNVSGEIIKQEHEATDQTGTNATIDYRYIGANPNNYVCLKDNNETCSEDELYRIIGVIPTQSSADGTYENRVKLIKNTSLEKYYWSGSNTNTSNNWPDSTLNTKVLNTDYWGKIQESQKYIEKVKWYLGGLTYENYISNKFYKLERGMAVYSGNEVYTMSNIGLLYASDYAYATSGNETVSRDTCLATSMGSDSKWYNSDCSNNDWLKKHQHILIHNALAESMSKVLMPDGYINGLGVASNLVPVYPSFYLKSNVKYLSGTGEQSNPYRITIE